MTNRMLILMAIARKEHPSWTTSELKIHVMKKRAEELEEFLK